MPNINTEGSIQSTKIFFCLFALYQSAINIPHWFVFLSRVQKEIKVPGMISITSIITRNLAFIVKYHAYFVKSSIIFINEAPTNEISFNWFNEM